MKKHKILPLLMIMAVGCSSTRYGNPEDQETVNASYGRTDLQSFSDAMVSSLAEAPSLSYLGGPGKGDDLRVIVYMGDIRNLTTEHLDTGGISDSIRTSLVKSGRFRFVAGDQGQDEIGDQVRFQQGSGRVDPAQAKAFGKQLGADVIVYGSLRSITKKKGRSLENLGIKTKDVFYQFTLNCENITTGEIIWSEQQDVTKTQKTSLFGS
ncbi:MAG: penicillin-binding protein activator LpoB [Planctomycetota bacterium]|jgi:hypothetical protein|nr:penicillin-binding protein activator LpoB [Planctomycetota bacterium]MDP6837619.1 penicillin-binding protein activator LpoB [Planctomycetota bacterium]MDP6957049.1 penicillin-binding protein activator LpoB [Planctomycetota bacterium]